MRGLPQPWVSVVPFYKISGRALLSRPPKTFNSVTRCHKIVTQALCLRSFRYGLRGIATEITATIEADHLHRIIHAANANVAHLWVLECLSLTHLPTSSVISSERRPVYAKNNTVRACIDAGSICPSWNPSHWDASNKNCAASSSQVIANVVIPKLQQSTTCRQHAVRCQQFPVGPFLVHDVWSLNRRSELAHVHRDNGLFD